MRSLVYKLTGVLLLIALGIGLSWVGRFVFPAAKSDAVEQLTYCDYIEQGDQLYGEQKYSQALAAYEQAVQIDPLDPLARIRIGQLYQLKNRYSEAEQELKFADQLDPGNPEILYRLGVIYNELRYWEDARDYLSKALDQLPADALTERGKVEAERGVAFLWLSLFPEAEASFSAAVSADAADLLSLHYFGLLVARRDLKEGRRLLEQISTLQSASPLALSIAINVPLALSFANDVSLVAKSQTALVHLDEIENTPDQMTKDMMYGVMYIEQALPSLALPYLKGVAEEQTDYQSAHYYLGYSYFLLGDISRALEELESSVELGSGPDGLSLYYLGQVYAYQQEWAKAVRAYEQSIDLGLTTFDAYYSLGHVLRSSAEYSKAAKAYRKALEVDSTSLSARRSLVYVLLQYLKDGEGAIAVATEGIQINDGDAQLHNLLGWALVENNSLEQAETELNRAIELDPSLAAAYLNLGALYEKKNLTSQSKEVYQRALDLDMEGDIAPLADKALDRLFK